MIDALQQAMYGFTEHPEYQTLPESIKSLHSPKEYAWLGTERDRLVERETQPDMDYTE
jgi:hypothetical protein